MPARKLIPRSAIQKALLVTGGARAESARLLGISLRTLQRRLLADPTIELPVIDFEWEKAMQRTTDIHMASEGWLYSKNVGPWSWYAREIDWDDEHIELEPRVMDDDEAQELLRDLLAKELMNIRAPTRLG